MREFHILVGMYQGDYPIYEGIEEFHKYHPDKPFRLWGRDQNPFDFKIGDWVEALDGYIIQLLYTKKMNHARGCYAMRFPMGTFTSFLLVSGVWKYSKLYAQFTAGDLNSLSGKSYQNRTKLQSWKKEKFAKLVAMGIQPHTAYIQADYPWRSKYNIMAKIGALLMDEEVVDIVKQNNMMYLDKIKEDETFSDENMVEYVKDFMKHVRRGSQVHLNSIVPLLQLLGKLPDHIQIGNTKKKVDAQEVPYESVPPPV